MYSRFSCKVKQEEQLKKLYWHVSEQDLGGAKQAMYCFEHLASVKKVWHLEPNWNWKLATTKCPVTFRDEYAKPCQYMHFLYHILYLLFCFCGI